MHILYIVTTLSISFFCITTLFLAQKSRASYFYASMNVCLLFYFLSMYSLYLEPKIQYIKLIFTFSFLTSLFVYLMILAIFSYSYKLIDRINIIALLSGAWFSFFTNWVVVDFIYIDDPLLTFRESFQIEYGILYNFIFYIALIFLRLGYLAYVQYRDNKVTPAMKYSIGCTFLFVFLVILSNYVYPVLFGSSKYSFMPAFWGILFCIGNFHSIIKHQYLNVQLVLTNSIRFLIFWGVFFSFLYFLFMKSAAIFYLENRFVYLSCCLLIIVLLYKSFQDFLNRISPKAFGNLKQDPHSFSESLSKRFTNCRDVKDIFNTFFYFIRYCETNSFLSKIVLNQNFEIYNESDLSVEIKDKYEQLYLESDELIEIRIEQNNIYVFIKLIDQDEHYGWLSFQLPIYKKDWVMREQGLFLSFIELAVNSIRLIRYYEAINQKIDALTYANEFVGFLTSQTIGSLQNIILDQLKQMFGFDYIIFPEFNEFNVDWNSSNVDVPIHIRSMIMSLNILERFNSPFEPINLVDLDLDQKIILTICEFYKCRHVFAIPIVKDDRVLCFYITLSKSDKPNVEENLLFLMNKQVSAIFYRSIINQKISSTQNFYQEIIDCLTSIVVIIDKNLTIKFKNQSFSHFFQKDYVNFNEIILDYPNIEIIHKILSFSDSEMTIDLNDRHFKLSLRQLIDENVIVVLTDVTDLIKIQHSISKSSKLKGMGTFVAGVAHEIKNPLVAVKTFTQLISKDWGNKDIRDKCYNVVLPQLHRISKLSNSLNHLGRTEKIDFEPLNLSNVIYETLDLLKSDYNHELLVDVSFDIEPNIVVFANKNAMEQVFLNIVLNAFDVVQNSDSPSIKINVFTELMTKVIVDISDNGKGIANDDIQYLFDPFFTTKDTGTGLGLSIVHQIVSDHQGKITVHETSSDGTTFRVVLPKLLRSKTVVKEKT